jgi:isopentenyl-diphosphate delta-isomerase
MSSEEIVHVLDNDGKVIGSITREEAERDMPPIKNVIIFVFNSLGKVWIQKRPMHKSNYGGLWDVSACGAVKAREAELTAATREQLEEMKFNSELRYVDKFTNLVTDDEGKEIRRFLSFLYISESEQIPIADQIEVDEFLALPPAELRQRVVDNPQEFVPTFLFEFDKAITALKG